MISEGDASLGICVLGLESKMLIASGPDIGHGKHGVYGVVNMVYESMQLATGISMGYGALQGRV